MDENPSKSSKAGDRIRTGDVQLGNVVDETPTGVICRTCKTRPIVYVHRQECAVCTFAVKPDPEKQPAYKACPRCLKVATKGNQCCPSCSRSVIGSFHPKTENFTAEPAEPTTASPGTHEKILAMRKRAERGGIFHPADARDTDNAPGIPAERTILFPPAADADSDRGDEADSLSDVLCVDALDHLRPAVTELVSYLAGSEASFDPIASVSVPQAVRRHTIRSVLVQARANRRTPNALAKGVLAPRLTVAVQKHELALACPLDRTQQPNRQPIEADDSRLARLAKRLVLGQVQMRLLATIQANRLPLQLSHLACAATSAVQKQQRPLQRTGANSHQGLELLKRRRPARLRYEAAQGPGACVRAGADQFLIAGPTEARKHRSDAPALGVDRLPRRMSLQELGQVVLPQIAYVMLAKLIDVAAKVSFIVLGQARGNFVAGKPLRNVSEVDADDLTGKRVFRSNQLKLFHGLSKEVKCRG